MESLDARTALVLIVRDEVRDRWDDLSAARNGRSALVSALARAERRPDTITAF